MMLSFSEKLNRRYIVMISLNEKSLNKNDFLSYVLKDTHTYTLTKEYLITCQSTEYNLVIWFAFIFRCEDSCLLVGLFFFKCPFKVLYISLFNNRKNNPTTMFSCFSLQKCQVIAWCLYMRAWVGKRVIEWLQKLLLSYLVHLMRPWAVSRSV